MIVSRRWEDAASLSKVTTKSEGSTKVRDSSSTGKRGFVNHLVWKSAKDARQEETAPISTVSISEPDLAAIS
jgi:hypothetical protein